MDHPLCCGWAQDWGARREGRREKKGRRPELVSHWHQAEAAVSRELGAEGTEQEGTVQEERGRERSWVGCTWRATARPLRVGQCHGHQRMPGRGVCRRPG